MRCPPLLALMLCLTLSPAAIAVETDEAGPPPAAESAPGAEAAAEAGPPQTPDEDGAGGSGMAVRILSDGEFSHRQ